MSLKKRYSKDKKTCFVTFTMFPEVAQGAQSITIAGDFNDWNRIVTPLAKHKDGSFSATLALKILCLSRINNRVSSKI